MPALTRKGATWRGRSVSWITIFLGLWLIASPWVFDYDGQFAEWNSVLVGALIAMLATVRFISWRYNVGVRGINLLLGFWTIVSPWATGYVEKKPALANDMMVGIFVMAFALWSARTTEPKQRRGGAVN